MKSKTIEKWHIGREFQDLVVFQPNAGRLWPGAVIKGASAKSGIIDIIPVKRSGGKLTVEDLTLASNGSGVSPTTSVDINTMSNGAVKDGITKIITQKAGDTPARIFFKSHQVFSFESSLLQAGASASWMSGEVKAALNKSSTATKNTFVVRFTQNYYTVSYEQPLRPSDVFKKKTKWKSLRNKIGSSQLPKLDPPMYIGSVTYGRQLLLMVESTYSAEAIDATLRATFGGAGWKANVSLTNEQKKLLNESDVTAFVLGGSANSALGLISKLDTAGLYKFLRDGANFNPYTSPGVPISYTLRYLSDNSLVKLAYAEDYDATYRSERPLNFKSVSVEYWTEGDDKDGPESVAAIVLRGETVVASSNYEGGGGEWDDQQHSGPFPLGIRSPFTISDCSKLSIRIDKSPDNGQRGSGWNFSFQLSGILENDKSITIRSRAGGDRLGDDQPRSKDFGTNGCPF